MNVNKICKIYCSITSLVLALLSADYHFMGLVSFTGFYEIFGVTVTYGFPVMLFMAGMFHMLERASKSNAGGWDEPVNGAIKSVKER